ncbi:uncharacterized protein LOC128190182 [Crassostrea angulata]|uniref:uncharacterized protein LOC128190182 n=1 Tax=Magallana angulata TaxID=2784310 RepID=UPI0022B1394F|nr:uncharacterized protein LOC128190182 [Crassostrea angulata]
MIKPRKFFLLSKMVLICLVLLLIADLFTNICSSAEDLDDGICNRSTIIPECCTDFVYNDTLMQCIVCVGGFGINCSQSCPQGYYGRRCMETCSCNITMCDNALGCPEAASDLDKDGRPSLGLFKQLALSGLAIVIVVLMIIILRVIYGCRLQSKRFGDGNSSRNKTNYEGMMASSLVRYSDVGHPMTPPELIVEQKDVIYVNMTMLQK